MKSNRVSCLKSLIFVVNFCWLSSAIGQQVPNVQQGPPGTLLSNSDTVPAMGQMGRLAIMETLGEYIVTIPEGPGSNPGSGLRSQLWDLSDLSNPRLLQNFSQTFMPYQAHGTVKMFNQSSGRVQVDLGGEVGATLRPDDSVAELEWEGPNDTNLFNLSAIAFPWTASNWGSYDFVSSQARLYHDNQLMGEWDHLGTTGVIGFALMMGDLLLYASDQANSGIASYDISDPSNPVLLDLFNEQIGPSGRRRGVGGYQAEIYGHYVVFASRPNDVDVFTGSFTVIDFSDPENLRLHCYIELDSEPMYVNFQDDHAFIDRSKINIEECRVDLMFPYDGHDMSQFSLPLGNILVAGGAHLGVVNGQTEQGMSIWVHQSEPDTRPPFVTYHIPQSGRTNYPLFAPISIHIPEKLRARTMVAGENIIVQPLGGNPIGINFRFSHSGLLTIDPDGDLQPGTTYEVILSGIEDYMGNAMAPYSFQFTTAGNNNNPPPPVISGVTTTPNPATAGSNVAFTIGATGNGVLEYRFDPANGDGLGQWTTSNTFATVYEDGSYQPRIFVRDSFGQVDSEIVQLSVLPLISEPGPELGLPQANASSQIICGVDSDWVWTINPDNDSVVAVSKLSMSLGASMTDTLDPRSIEMASDGTIWVTGMESDSIDIYTTSGVLIDRIEMGYGSAPYGLVSDHKGANMYASLYGSGQIVRLDISSRSETGRINLGPTPRALAVTPDDERLLVTRYISPENRGEIYEVKLSNFSLNQIIALNKEDDPDSLFGGRGVPNYISSIVIAPAGDRAYFTGKKDNTDKGLITNSGPLDDDNSVRAIIGFIDLDNSTELYESRRDIDNRSSPSALTFSPNADYLFVALQGNNEVLAFPRDAQGDLATETGFFEAGLAPQAVCMDSESQSLYVKNFLDRSLSQIDLAQFLEFGSLNPEIQVVGTVNNESLPADVLAGKQIFYNAGDDRMSAEGYISCASCHIDGGHDGRTWDFTARGEGLRNTLSLNGKQGVTFGPAHWSGNFDEIQDFEHDIRDRFQGGGFLTNQQYSQTSPLGSPKTGLSQDLDNLSMYVTSLGEESLPKSPFRSADGSWTQSGLAGAAIFVQQGCNACHSNDWYTDGEMHNVGTLTDYSGERLGDSLEGLQTPTLLSAFSTAPYLHDGRAKTLSQVFQTVGGSVHQAESGILSGASELNQTVFRNFRRGISSNAPATAVYLDAGSASSIMINNIDGATGGVARVSLRAMGEGDKSSHRVTVIVNGIVHTATVSSLQTVNGEQSGMDESSVIQTNLQPGNNNTIEIRNQESSSGVFIDHIIVGNVEYVELANPHLRVSQLSSSDRSSLVSFLMQIDRHKLPDTGSVSNPVIGGGLGNSDSFATNRNTPITIGFDELLENDGAETGFVSIPVRQRSGKLVLVTADFSDDFRITGVINTNHGMVQFNQASSNVTFNPQNGFTGRAKFDYLLFDGSRVSNVEVNINVTQ